MKPLDQRVLDNLFRQAASAVDTHPLEKLAYASPEIATSLGVLIWRLEEIAYQVTDCAGAEMGTALEGVAVVINALAKVLRQFQDVERQGYTIYDAMQDVIDERGE